MRLLSHLNEADWVIGSRENSGSGGPVFRRLSSFLMSKWTYHQHRVELRDPCSGMWALNSNAMHFFCELLPLPVMEANLRIEALRRGLLLREVTVPMRERPAGSSMHDGLKGFVHFANSMLELRRLSEK